MRVQWADPLRIADDERAAMEEAALAVMRDGPWVLGEWVEAFEDDFAVYLGGGSTVVGVASGSDALVLALTVLDLPAGSDVLVPPNDGGYAAWAVRSAGLRPVAMDVDARTHRVTVTTAQNAITAGTSAVVVTHLHGGVVDVEGFVAWCDSRALRLVEDCAQSHGARVGDRLVGTWGDAAAFSFYPTKNLGAMGDGGAVVVRDADHAVLLRQLRAYGWGERFRIDVDGGRNSRLDALQAAVLSARLPFLDANNAARRAVLDAYPATEHFGWLTPGTGGVVHHAVALTDHRDDLARHLADRGVGTAVHYPWLVGEMPGLAMAGDAVPVADAGRCRKLSVPCFPTMSTEEIAIVTEALLTWAPEGGRRHD